MLFTHHTFVLSVDFILVHVHVLIIKLKVDSLIERMQVSVINAIKVLISSWGTLVIEDISDFTYLITKSLIFSFQKLDLCLLPLLFFSMLLNQLLLLLPELSLLLSKSSFSL